MNHHSRQFRNQAPELLRELAQHTTAVIKTAIEIDPLLAEQIGDAVMDHMMRVWGGQNIYVPMGKAWRISQRDKQLFAEFNGKNYHQLARKYGCSLQWVYAVIKRVQQAEKALNSLDNGNK